MAKVTKRQRAKIDKALDKLLAERRVSTGGYAPVTDQDMEQLHALVYAIIEAKWSDDPDGDVPVEYSLINRKTHGRLHYLPIPYEHKVKNFEEARARISLVLTNLSMAQDDMSKTLRMFMDFDLPRLGLTYQNWHKGSYPPRARGYYWAWSKALLKGWQVVEVRYNKQDIKTLVVHLPGSSDQYPLTAIKTWGPEVLNYPGGPLPWGDAFDE